MAETRTAKKKVQTVLAVSADRGWLQSLGRALTAIPDVQFVGLDTEAFREGRFDRDATDAVVLDLGDGSVLRDERFLAVRQDIARSPLIVISGELAHDLARLVIRLGSTDWLQKPVDQRQLVDSVLQLLRVNTGSENRVYAVMSCVGGAGGTTLAISAAHLIARDARGAANTCALVDLDFTKASCGIYLDVQNDVDLTGVVESPHRVDAEFMDLVRRDYRDMFSVFSFARPETAYAPTGEEFVLRMMDVLSYQYRNVVIDMPYHYTPWRDRIFEVADGVILATEMTIPAIRQAQLIHASIKARRKADLSLVVVVNHHRRKLFSSGIGRRDVAKTLAGTSLLFVPDDWDTLQDAVNRGIAPADAAPRSGFVKKSALAIQKMRTKEAAS